MKARKKITSLLLAMAVVISMTPMFAGTVAAANALPNFKAGPDGVISWNHVSGADAYLIDGLIPATSISVTQAGWSEEIKQCRDWTSTGVTFRLKDYLDLKELCLPGNYTVKVRAQKNNANLGYESQFTFTYNSNLKKMPNPLNLHWDGTTVYWDPVPAATEYQLLLNTGSTTITSRELTGNHYTFDASLFEYSYYKKYNFLVKADADGYVRSDKSISEDVSGAELLNGYLSPGFSRETHAVTAGTLNVREGPGSSYSRIGGLTSGKRVTVVNTQGEWSKIQYDSGYGWVMSQYLRKLEVYTIYFNANGGSGSMSTMRVKEGDPLKLPECTFIPAKGKTFDRWIAGNPGEYVDVSGSSTIRAFWKWVNPFYDIYSSDIYYDAVLWAYYADPQITNGIDKTLFGPDMIVTRGQAVTFLWRSQGCPEPSSSYNPFVDISSGKYYYKPVLWALEKGITKGVDAKHFNPDDTLSTQHIITFLYRTKNPGKDGWYGEAENWAADYSGKPFGVDIAVNNTTPCPRSHVVMFLYNLG